MNSIIKQSIETRVPGASKSNGLVKALASSISKDLSRYENQELAGHMIVWCIVRNSGSFEEYVNFYRERLNKNTLDFFTKYNDEIQEYLDKNVDLNYYNKDYFSASTIIHNYLLRCDTECHETPLQMYLRIATQLHHDSGIRKVLEVTNDLAMCYYSPSSPTFFNSGTKKNQLASCFLIPIQDNLQDILYTGVGDSGIISSLSGGLGLGVSKIRHSSISNGGKSDGIIPVCKVYDKLINYANQSGRRSGAATAFLRSHHIDILDFIAGTDNFTNHEARFTSLNTCIWMSRLFFKRLASGGNWTLFCPARTPDLDDLYGYEWEERYIQYENEATELMEEFKCLKLNHEKIKSEFEEESTEQNKKAFLQSSRWVIGCKKRQIDHKVVKASHLYDKIIDMQVKCGMPYICHGDPVNSKSNHMNLGTINNSNLCLEIMEYAPPGMIASCNLASINLTSFAEIYINDDGQTERVFNFQKLGEITMKVTDNLNQVINKNYYPLEKISKLNKETRPIGLGISGLSDAFAKMDIVYGSDESIMLNKKIFACMYFNALLESIDQALKYGEYEDFRSGSFVLDGNTYNGSPLSNGLFQFDLWKIDADNLKKHGDLSSVYDEHDDKPICPSKWKQEPFQLSNGFVVSPEWECLRDAVIKFGVRNSMLLSLMPTASTAQAIRNAETTELHQTNIYSRNVQSGHFTVLNRWMVSDLLELDLWDEDVCEFIILCEGSLRFIGQFFRDNGYDIKGKEDRIEYLKKKYVTQFEVSQRTCMLMARQRGIYIDQSQSLNIYMRDPDTVKLQAAHKYGYGLNLKTGQYYLRCGSPSNAGTFAMNPKIKKYYKSLLESEGFDTEMTGVSIHTKAEEKVCEMCA